jgi:hypothetical protein
MKHLVKNSIALAVIGSAFVAGSAMAGIANTKHNLGTTQPSAANNSTTDGTGEICIFCHTPHGGDTGAAVPLWNKRLTSATFTTYDDLGTSTLDAGILDVGSVSLACLTCHDGTQAIDNIRNNGGSGLFDASGGGDLGLTWTWDSPNGSLDSNGQFVAGPDTGGSNITTIGTDLRNDHPIGVQYGGGGITSGGGTTNDEDFFQPAKVTGIDRWYVDNKVMGTAGDGFDKWDFKLYTRDTSAEAFRNTATSTANGPEPFVECGSCHDPHLETTTFLRIDPASNGGASNNGSKVCLTCHNK